MADRIDKLEDGTVDDVVVEEVELLRMEMLSDKELWVCAYKKGDAEAVSFRVNCVKNKLVVREY